MRVLNKFICLLPFFLFLFILVGCDITIGTDKNQEEFEVKFLVDGEVISSEKVKYGESATEVVIPSKEGYNFVGWDKEFTKVKSNLEVNAIYKKKIVKVKIYIDGELYETKEVEYGESVEIDEPVKEGYQFIKWDKDLNSVKEDIEVNAIFNEKKLAEINFYVDGALYETKIVMYGESVEIEDPEIDGYTFIKWDKDLNNVKEDMEVNAILEAKDIKIDFFVDGKLYDTKTIKYGDDVEYIKPEKEGYNFVRWDKDLDNVKEDIKVNAIFEEKVITVKFFVDEVLYMTKNVKYGEIIEIDEPVKKGYQFIKWDKDLNNIKEDIEVNAVFEKIDIQDEKLENVFKTLEDYFNGLTYPLENCYLNLIDKKDDVTIEWTSSNENIIMLTGQVVQPYTANKEERVILTANLKFNEYTMNAKFNVKVKRGYKDLTKGINAVYNSYSSSLSEAALSTYDIVYYAFLGLKEDASGNLGSTYSVINNIKGYKDKLHAQGGRVLVSVVAQTKEAIPNIKAIISNEKSLTNLANNLLNFCIDNDYDGIDIDWETPGTSGGEAYTKLMKKLYETFKAYDENLLITSAIGAGPWQPPRYNLQESAQYHDYINMMAYDMQAVNNWNTMDGVASFQNALYYKYKATSSGCSIDETIVLYNSYGIKNSQIIIGVPFYGRVLKGATTLWGSGVWSGSINQATIKSYIESGTYKVVYDEKCQVPYLYSESENEFITYENEKSIDIKWGYIASHGLAGMMAWQIRQDSEDKLTLAMKNGKDKYM